jgi:hypothetical protein
MKFLLSFTLTHSKRLLSIAVFTALYGPAFSQIKSPAPIMPSANDISLGNFTELPASLNTGIPNISIPLYTLQANTISVPITISYHAAGVKPELHPSWTGLNWSLGAAGSISRTVNGAPDEWDSPNSTTPQRGYYFTHGRNTRSDWASTSYLQSYNVNDLGYDIAPDMFQFSFPGHSGKFFLDDAGNWQIQCDRPVKVIFNNNDFIHPFAQTFLTSYWDRGTTTFNKFTIIDEYGIQYVFGEPDAIEYSDDLVAADGRAFLASSWQLRRIISADGIDVVEFNYERSPFQSFIYRNVANNRVVGYNNGIMDPGCTSFYYGMTTAGKITSPVYLKSIGYARKNLRIDFGISKSDELSYTQQDYGAAVNSVYGTSPGDLSDILDYLDFPYYSSHPYSIGRNGRFIWFKLDNMNIVNTQSNTTIRSVIFNYNNVSTQRLKLLGLDYKDQNSATAQSYSFTYNTTSLPGYLVSRCDHWGYNNGAAGYTSNISNFYQSKEPQLFNAQAGILTDIVYPTGGKTTFEYELNHYGAAVNSGNSTVLDAVNADAGGLRVKKIKAIDNTGLETIKEYYYVKNYTAGANPLTLPTSGILDAMPKYEFVNMNGVDLAGAGFTWTAFSSNPVIPLTLTSTGQHIGYSEVVEKNGDGSYTIYKFTNHDNGYGDDNAVNAWNRSQVPYIPRSSHDFERGRPKEKNMFNAAGAPVQSEVYEYDRISSSTGAAKVIDQAVTSVCPGSAATRGFVSRSAYYLYFYPFVTKKITTTKYENGSLTKAITTTQDFTYTNRLPKTIILTGSKAEELRTENFYAQDFSGTAPYNIMVQKNMIAFPIQSDAYRAGSLTKRIKTEYASWGNGGIYPQYVKEQIGANALETSMQVNSYDANGNITQQTPRNGLKESYLWGYNKTLPIAQAVNANANEIFFTSFEEGSGWDGSLTAYDNTRSHSGNYSGRIDKPTSGEQTSMSTNWLAVSLPVATKYRYSAWVYSNGPSVELFLFMKRTGETGYFSYVDAVPTSTTGQWVHLEKEFLVPADVTQLNIRLDNNGSGSVWFDDIRLLPSAARMNSFTYDPLVGMTTSSDANDRIAYYEYDAFQRLLRIRDDNRNIIKQLDYQYKAPWYSTPNWQPTGNYRCINNSGTREREEIDNTPQSDTYHNKRWVFHENNCTVCPGAPNYQNSGDPFCETTPQNGNYTGWLVQNQIDVNPCSPTYGQTNPNPPKTYNENACPLPVLGTYVQLTLTNYYTDWYDNSVYADVNINIWNDANGTIPLTPPSPLLVHYIQDDSYANYYHQYVNCSASTQMVWSAAPVYSEVEGHSWYYSLWWSNDYQVIY